MTLLCSQCRSSISPDRRMMVIWNEYSRLYVYSLDNGVVTRKLTSTIMESIYGWKTDDVLFSSDSTNIILENDFVSAM